MYGKFKTKYTVFFLFFFFLNLFIYFWLCWVFVSVRGLSLVAASGGHSSSQCAGLSLSRPLLLRSTGSRRTGSVVVAHGPSCSAACGIFPNQGSNPCPLHWQADSQPLRHQGSPYTVFWFLWSFQLAFFFLLTQEWCPFIITSDLSSFPVMVSVMGFLLCPGASIWTERLSGRDGLGFILGCAFFAVLGWSHYFL